MTQPLFMRISEVSALLGMKPAAISRNVRAGGFPRPFLIGVKAKAFRKDEIDAWLAERDAARADYADPAVPSPRPA